jgi:hypothetical protein
MITIVSASHQLRNALARRDHYRHELLLLIGHPLHRCDGFGVLPSPSRPANVQLLPAPHGMTTAQALSRRTSACRRLASQNSNVASVHSLSKVQRRLCCGLVRNKHFPLERFPLAERVGRSSLEFRLCGFEQCVNRAAVGRTQGGSCRRLQRRPKLVRGRCRVQHREVSLYLGMPTAKSFNMRRKTVAFLGAWAS